MHLSLSCGEAGHDTLGRSPGLWAEQIQR